jgi:putative ABC transport system ATP-binding protein
MAAAASFGVAARGTGGPTEVVPPKALLVELSSVSKDYATGGGLVHAVRDVDLRIAHGEFVAIVGASGSGKSTMMNVIGCLDRPTTGTYELAGIDVGGRDGDSRAIIRNRIIGFIFQGFNLLPRTTALENVELPLQYRGVRGRERRRRAKAALEAVGLSARLDHNPSQLSGGQQQRVAIARALVTDPPLLLADEPTGNLDTRTSLEVLALLQRLNRERGITVILVTHERDVASCASRVITMRDGRIVSDVVQSSPLDAAAEVARMPVAEEEAEGPSVSATTSVSPAARLGGPIPFGVYAAMWLGEMAGGLVGAAYAGFVVHLGALQVAWVARVVGEISKAWAGARWARRAFGKPATVDQRVRMALWYTMVVTCGALAALLGVVLALPAQLAARAAWAFDWIAPITDRGPAVVVAVVAAAVAALVLLRFLLLSLFEPRR